MLHLLWILTVFSFYNIVYFGVFLFLVFIAHLRLKKLSKEVYDGKILTFIHPNCNDCGGGEKVLWNMLRALVSNFNSKERVKINIIAGHEVPATEIMKKVKERFNLEFTDSKLRIELIRLNSGFLLKPFPFLTMIVQIFGQIVFALELLLTVYSDIVLDTTGLPFMLPVFKVLGRTTSISYVHYPLISYDMINQVRNGESGVHSRGFLSKFPFFRYLKLVYLSIVYYAYRVVGYFVDHAYTNSTWTDNHMKDLWKNLKTQILYPPCGIKLYESRGSYEERKNQIVSFAQFRPEKNHKMQVEIFEMVSTRLPTEDLKMYIIGSIRGNDDRQIFEDVNSLIRQKGLEKKIFLVENPHFDMVKSLFNESKIGIHTMRDEHFGISIVEMMSAGLLTIAHKSGGPLNDIIGSTGNVGLLASSAEEYAEQVIAGISNYKLMSKVIKDGVNHVKKFSDETFMEAFFYSIKPYISSKLD